MSKVKRVIKNFTYREAKKLLQCIKGNYTTSTYGAYTGVRDNREVQIIKKNGKQIEWVMNNWRIIPDGFRQLCLNEAIWKGADFSNKQVLNSFVGQGEDEYDPYLVMSGVNKIGKSFAYDIKDNKAMQRILKMADIKNAEVGPVIFIVYSDENGNKQELQIRNLKLMDKVIEVANKKGKKLKVKIND